MMDMAASYGKQKGVPRAGFFVRWASGIMNKGMEKAKCVTRKTGVFVISGQGRSNRK